MLLGVTMVGYHATGMILWWENKLLGVTIVGDHATGCYYGGEL